MTDKKANWFRLALATAVIFAAEAVAYFKDRPDQTQAALASKVLDTALAAEDDDAPASLAALVGWTAAAVDVGFVPPGAPDEYDPQWDDLKQRAIETGSALNDAQLRLADKRKGLDATIAKLTETFEASNAELIQEVEDAEIAQKDADDQLRAAILLDYIVKGDKQIAPGLSVRINKAFQYSDADAVAFAIERKMPELLEPNKKSFDKQMALTPQPFATTHYKGTTVVSLK